MYIHFTVAIIFLFWESCHVRRDKITLFTFNKNEMTIDKHQILRCCQQSETKMPHRKHDTVTGGRQMCLKVDNHFENEKRIERNEGNFVT